MYTVGEIAKRFDLSRSTLLYYDRVGLLSPRVRSRAGYRQYTKGDLSRLAQIRKYREAGLPVAEIRKVLDGSPTALVEALEQRLEDLNTDIRRLRDQQRIILGLLQKRSLMKRIAVMNKDRWVSLLRAAGYSEEDMSRWHRDFERTAPGKHQEFLEFLCIPHDEIRAIRKEARRPAVK